MQRWSLHSICKECGGSGIFQHGHRTELCKDCGGGGLCDCGQQKQECQGTQPGRTSQARALFSRTHTDRLLPKCPSRTTLPTAVACSHRRADASIDISAAPVDLNSSDGLHANAAALQHWETSICGRFYALAIGYMTQQFDELFWELQAHHVNAIFSTSHVRTFQIQPYKNHTI